MRNSIKQMHKASVFLMLLLTALRSDATTYYSRTSGQWNLSTSWSTVTYGDPTNAGTYPVAGDMVYIGDGHTILLASSSTCAGLNIGQGTSGILDYPNFGTITLTISGSLTVNSGAQLRYNYNNTRTHNLFISGDITNNGSVDLFSDANDVVNLILNGAANCNITGSGSYEFNLVTMSKASRSYSINVQSAAFLNAAPPATTNPRIDLVKGTFVCNTASTVTWTDPVATSYTIPMDVVLEVRSGTVYTLTAGDTLINSGKIYITGGILEAGSSAGRKGILNKDAGATDPEIEITAGTLKTYGGLSYYSGTNPYIFRMTGGNLDLNSGSVRTDGYVLGIPNTAGSQFVMTGGNIYIRKPSTTASTPEMDFGSSSVYHNVTDGHVYFGDGTTSYSFDYMPYVSYTYPHMEVSGTSGTSLKPYTFISSKMLSIKVNTNNTFDISSGGTNGTSTQITLSGTLDGLYAIYNDGTINERIGQFILSGTQTQYVYTVAGESNIYNMTVNNPAGIYLDRPVTITGALTLTNGILYTSSTNLLTFNSGATVSGASNSSHVDGPVKKVGNTAFTFPVGDNNLYRPLSMSAPSVATDEFTAEYFAASPDPTYDRSSHAVTIDHISNNEYWTLNRVAGSSNVNVTLTWNTNSGGVDDLNSLRVAQWDGSAWQDQGNGGTSGTFTSGTIINSLAPGSFGPFTLASSTGSNNPLPVELVSFTANAGENYNQLNWSTASEVENDFFEIEKTTDGINYSTIGKVDGAGTTVITQHYQFKDFTSDTKSCYRLKQTDFNGKFSYSEIKCVSRSHRNEVKIYPSVIKDEPLKVDLSGESFNDAKIIIRDVTGREVYRTQVSGEENIYSINACATLNNGCYVLSVILDDQQIRSGRFIKN